MNKKMFAVLLTLTFTFVIFSNKVLAASVTANDFISIRNNYNSNILQSSFNYSKQLRKSDLYAFNNIQPDFNLFVESILKIIYKIVPAQFADGTLYVSPKELEARKSILKRNIKFENDIRLFTLYAFMNYTGYYDSSNNSESSSVRTMLMEDLKKMNLTLSDNKYYMNKDIQSSYYRNALRDLGSPPKFEIIGHKGNIINCLLDLPENLREFYLKADIESLYNKFEPYYNTELRKFEDKSLTALVILNNYLKINNEDVPKINIEINLLDACGKGTSFTSIDKYKGNAVITLVPSKDQYIQGVIHEYLHFIINPIVDNLQSAVSKLEYKAKDIPSDSQAYLYYKDWSANINESIVKALEYRVVGGNRKASIENAEAEGFILTQYFDERFDEFKNYNGSLNNFIEYLLQDYINYKK